MDKFRTVPRIELSILLILLAIFIAAFVVSFTFVVTTESYPRLVSGLGIALVSVEIVVFLIQTYRRRQNIPSGEMELRGMLGDIRKVLPYLVWIMFYFLLIYLIGLVIASALFAVLFLFFVAQINWRYAILGGLLAFGGTFVIVDVLQLGLPQALWDPFSIWRSELRLPF